MTAILTAAVCAAFPMAAQADSSSVTNLTLFESAEPAYTVTVPENIEVAVQGNTDVAVKAEAVKNLPQDKKISVTLAKGSGVFGRLYLTAENPENPEGKQLTLTLYVTGTDGEPKMGALENQIKGMELAAFTEDGKLLYYGGDLCADSDCTGDRDQSGLRAFLCFLFRNRGGYHTAGGIGLSLIHISEPTRRS